MTHGRTFSPPTFVSHDGRKKSRRNACLVCCFDSVVSFIFEHATRKIFGPRLLIGVFVEIVRGRNGQECQWSGQKLYGSAECVWLSLKFTHYQIFYQRLILFNVQEGLQTSPGIWCFPQGCAPIERLLMQLLTFFCKHRDRWSRDHDCRRCCNEQWIQ